MSLSWNNFKTIVKDAENVFDGVNNSSIIPTVHAQTSWQYGRTGNQLHLSDGFIVHSFDVEHESDDGDFPVKKLPDLTVPEFHKLEQKGTVQIHTADPGSIYMTLHDGKVNPTYTFKHEGEDSWRAMPKLKKSAVEIAATPALDGIAKGIDWLGRKTVSSLMTPGHNPTAAALTGLGVGAAYDFGKRWLYNTDEENDEETTTQRALRYAIPAGGLGLLGSMTSSTFPNYYKHYPTYKP